ncbi:MAG: hypothetical protein WA874_08065 [Chryseosolibacter sp.]
MRRPSRQGLAPVCLCGNVQFPASPRSPHEGEKRFFPFSGWFHNTKHSRNKIRDHLIRFSQRTAVPAGILIVFLMVTISSDAQDPEEETQKYFSAIRQGSYSPLPAAFSKHEKQTFEMLRPFLKDSADAVKLKAYEAMFAVISNATDPSLRTEGINLLMFACNAREWAVRSAAHDFLKHFDKKEFTVFAKDSLRKYIKSEVAPLDVLIKIAGFLQLSDLVPDIRPWAQPGNAAQLRWAALLSLARMGDAVATNDVMQRVKRQPINDDLIYSVFPDLVYTRQRGAIAYMVEALQSDRNNCLSADTERESSIPCGYRIMEQLAPIIDGFPLQLNETGDLETDDYPAALARVRQWFIAHSTYTIMNDRY